MTILQAGSYNLAAQLVPDLIVGIVPPSNTLINGVPTNVLGIVGGASWGPVNSPTVASGVTDGTRQFGQPQVRKSDLMTAVAGAALQGANNFRLVRVTDGTDTAASAAITCANAALATALASAINNGANQLRGPSQLVVATSTGATLTLTARYTGTTGNTLQASLGAGSAAGTSKLVVALPGQNPETFDNIGASASTSATSALTGGTDGTAGITSATLVGTDGTVRKGMYALRGTGCSVGMLADADDSTLWTTQIAFGLFEGVYMFMTTPAGDTIANAVATKAAAGIDSYAGKILFGDWCYVNDNVNGVMRLISQQAFSAGKRAALSPEQSTLNKPLLGIVATQKSAQNQVYSAAELQLLAQAGIDVITNPAPGGNYFAARLGRNTSSNAVIHGDNYTSMTNFLASTYNAGLGQFIGTLIYTKQMRQIKATLDYLHENLKNAQPNPMIQDADVQIDALNNPQSQTALGQENVYVRVRYLSIAEVLALNLEGGQSVQITRVSTQRAA